MVSRCVEHLYVVALLVLPHTLIAASVVCGCLLGACNDDRNHHKNIYCNIVVIVYIDKSHNDYQFVFTFLTSKCQLSWKIMGIIC